MRKTISNSTGPHLHFEVHDAGGRPVAGQMLALSIFRPMMRGSVSSPSPPVKSWCRGCCWWGAGAAQRALERGDDISAADIGSAVAFTVTANEPLFIVAEAQAGYGRYTFRCQGGAAALAGSSGRANSAAPTPTLDAKALRIDMSIN